MTKRDLYIYLGELGFAILMFGVGKTILLWAMLIVITLCVKSVIKENKRERKVKNA